MVDRTRRTLLLGGGAAAAGAGLLLARPADRSGPRDPYFEQMQILLRREGHTGPTLLIDRERLDHNIALLASHLPADMGYRIVAKSLPSLSLLARIRRATGTHRLMTFNLPMLMSITQSMPDCDQLLGKPLPVEAAAQFVAEAPRWRHPALTQVQWLVDSPSRLRQYADLAGQMQQRLRINLELDVGLHRGGFVADDQLQQALQAIAAHPHLQWSGFMGYEPHVPALPEFLGWRTRALASAWHTYGSALQMAEGIFGAQAVADSCRNAAGSPTYRLYRDTQIANEVSAGSCLLKPTDFDQPLLADFLPAAFIATPALKGPQPTQLPGLPGVAGAMRWWDPNSAQTLFIHGGNWLAEPVDPPGLQLNPVFGRSSNHEMWNAGARLPDVQDQWVFFRPRQSEAVLLQFGSIAVYAQDRIIEHWPVLPPSA